MKPIFRILSDKRESKFPKKRNLDYININLDTRTILYDIENQIEDSWIEIESPLHHEQNENNRSSN